MVEIFKKHGLEIFYIGETTVKQEFVINNKNKEVAGINVSQMAETWINGLRNKF